ncbi:MAG: group II intron reverse transcriptase/maturase [Planctomycetes bacterium]|nr:group II intron reverse transcriptase/maturase [Planctomycetota bacterium]
MNIHVCKTVPIEYNQVLNAYRKVKRGGKAAGIDNESWEEFDQKSESNLYVIWNRLASGSYHPQAVREVEIPKKGGQMRKLGIPTLRDRIAQQVVKDYMEKRIDCLFHENSYGYRPMKSAHQAIDRVKQNCYRYDWVIDMDISKFFDEIDHVLMLKAVEHVSEEKWVKMYVERWLGMPVHKQDGTLQPKAGKGTPQGGVISPLLANLYLHFSFDVWLSKHYPQVSFVRYADDAVVHCTSRTEAETVLESIKQRLAEVKLQVNEEKTRISYCRDYRRRAMHSECKFEFLGFSYQPRARKSKRDGKNFTAFAAEISQSNQKRIRSEIREVKIWRNTKVEISDISKLFNAKLRGWIAYYGKYSKRSLRNTLLLIDRKLVKWLGKKRKIGYRKAVAKLKTIKHANPELFYHWKTGYS